MANTFNNVKSTVSVLPSTMTGTVTTSIGAVGASGSYLISGTNGSSYTTSWANPSTNFNSSSNIPILTIPHGEEKVIVHEKATLEVKGNVVINGIDLEERLKTIEKVLMIPERDAIMEAKYPSLKKKFDEYINALEKYKTFERIKGTYD